MCTMLRPVLAVGVLLAAAHAHADVLYVDAGRVGGLSDGTSWTNAFSGRTALQSALAAAKPGDEIWVAAGMYAPARANAARTESFVLTAGVGVYAGFAGSETDRAQRDPSSHLATLTGDLNSNDPQSREDNSFHVVRAASGADASTILDGFRITGGVTGQGNVDGSGGGLMIIGASPSVRNCTFAGNEATARGGDAAVFSGAPLFDQCTFTGTSFAQSGLGLLHSGTAAATLRGCRFIGAPPTTGGMQGVGIYSDSISVRGLTVESCEFSIVSAEFTCPAGVGIYAAPNTRLAVSTSRFIDNFTCGGGGGIHCDGLGVIDRCVFIGNEGKFDGGAAIFSFDGETTVTNSLFAGNDREGFSTIMAQGIMHFVNCTFAFNGDSAAQHFLSMSIRPESSFTNCIIWGNESIEGDAQAVVFEGAVLPAFNHCLVQGWDGTLPGVGSFAADPGFVDPDGADGVAGTIDDDLRLAPGSACIDRGENAAVPAAFTRDLADVCRLLDDPATKDAGISPAPEVDLGAFEFAAGRCPTDLNCDGASNSQDFFDFLASFFAQGDGADFNADMVIDSRDFFDFLAAFFAGCD